LCLEIAHIEPLTTLPLHHKDPFDRLVAATALVEGLTLVSADSAFDAYDVKRLWSGVLLAADAAWISAPAAAADDGLGDGGGSEHPRSRVAWFIESSAVSQAPMLAARSRVWVVHHTCN